MKKRILVKGPALTRSGYGEQTRFALRALRSKEEEFDIYIQPLAWGQTSWTNEFDEERAWIDDKIETTIEYIQTGGQFDMSLQVTIPNEWENLAPVNVGYTAGIETTKVAPEWIDKGNQMNKIVVVSSHSKQVYENTAYIATNQDTGEQVDFRLSTPVESVGYPVKSYDSVAELPIKLKTGFNFLSVAQFGPRKNLAHTVGWFIEEFENENVGLVLKTNIAKNSLIDREKITKDIQEFVARWPNRKCKVYILHGDMTDEEMHALYTHPQISAMLSLTHGEGFGLPLFEAAYSGLPVVAPGWSGQLDFLVDSETGEDKFYSVAFDLNHVQEAAVWPGVVMKDSMWAYPRPASARTEMRKCYTDHVGKDGPAARESAEAYAETLKERFGEQVMYEAFVEAIGTSTSSVDEEIESLFEEIEL